MLWNAKNTLYLGFALTGVMAITSAGIARLAHVQEETIQQDIKQTHALVRDLDELENATLRATTLMRAFVISGDSSSISQLPAIRKDEYYIQSRIEAKVKADSGLTAHYNQYVGFIEQRRAFVNNVIDARIRQGFSAAKTMEATSEDDRLFDLMQRNIEAMQDLALSKLTAQESLNQRLQKRIARYETFALFLTLAFLIAMGVKLTAVTIENSHLYSDLVHRSEYDQLTDIPNRHKLENDLRQMLRDDSAPDDRFALIFIDLDRFKQINDNYGHGVGDLFLQHVVHRMKKQLRTDDLLARLGGDEFAVLLPSVSTRLQAVEVVHRLERCFEQPFSIAGLQIYGSASMGIAYYPDDGVDIEALLHTADIAMYATKQNHRESVLQCRKQLHRAV